MRSTSASSSRIPWSRAARKSSLRNWSKRGTPYGRELGCSNGFTRSAVPCAEAWLAHMTPSASPPATIVLCRCMRSPSDGSRPRGMASYASQWTPTSARACGATTTRARPSTEEAYVLGTGTASIPDPEVFRREASLLTRIVEHFARGRLVDLACGTGYWLPSYVAACSSITLIDQAPRMLQECRKKIASLDALDRITVVQDDVLEHAFRPRAFDSALIGFLISHLTDEEERQLFERLKTMLDTDGCVLDSRLAWSPERARFNRKTKRQERLAERRLALRHLQALHRSATRRRMGKRKYGVATSIEHFGRRSSPCPAASTRDGLLVELDIPIGPRGPRPEPETARCTSRCRAKTSRLEMSRYMSRPRKPFGCGKRLLSSMERPLTVASRLQSLES